MKKKVFWLLLAIVCCVPMNKAVADDVDIYFTTEQLADLLKCLPAPPDTIGADFTHDIMRYMWGKQQRLNSERAAIARRDAVWNFDSLFTEFNVPFGLVISKENTPEIYKLLISGLSTLDQMRVRPKAYYMRKRPYVRFNEHMLTTEEEEELRNEGSYPSGHTCRGWGAALLLTEINTAAADTIMARGYMYCESRVIVGAHWQSDVDASRLAASIGVAQLHASPAFLKQMQMAKDEFARLTRRKL